MVVWWLSEAVPIAATLLTWGGAPTTAAAQVPSAGTAVAARLSESGSGFATETSWGNYT